MEKLKLERKTFKVEIYGQEYDVRRPKMSESADLEDKLSQTDNDRQKMDITQDLLATLGVPKEITSDMDTADVMELLKFLSDSKKK